MPKHFKPLYYPSIFKPDILVSETTWVITQAAMETSTRRRCIGFEAGHSVLFIEAVVKNEEKSFNFDYRVKKPHEIKNLPDEKKESKPCSWFHELASKRCAWSEEFAWLHKNEDLIRFQTKANRALTESKERIESWEIKASTGRKLLKIFNKEYEKQYDSSLPAKHYSFIWENCHFLMAEKLNEPSIKNELKIDTTNAGYIDKFHLGGWKYSIIINFSHSITFATLISPLQLMFISYTVLTNNHDSFEDDFTLSDAFFPIILNFFNHTAYLLCLAIMSYLSFSARKSILDFCFNFIVTSLYMFSALAMHTLMSTISRTEYFLLFPTPDKTVVYEDGYNPISNTKIFYLSLITDILIPAIALFTSFGLTSLLFRIANHFNSDFFSKLKSQSISELTNLQRDERLQQINNYLATVFIPISGLILNLIAKHGSLVSTYNTNANKKLDNLDAALLSYFTGCILGYILLQCFSNTAPSLSRLMKPLTVSYGSLISIYSIMKFNIADLHFSLFRWKVYLSYLHTDNIAISWPGKSIYWKNALIFLKGKPIYHEDFSSDLGIENAFNLKIQRINDEMQQIDKQISLNNSTFLSIALYSLVSFIDLEILYFLIANWRQIPTGINKLCHRAKDLFCFFKTKSDEEKPLNFRDHSHYALIDEDMDEPFEINNQASLLV